MTDTKLTLKVDTDCHEIMPNAPLSERIARNLRTVGAPTYTEEELAFARKLQAPLVEAFGTEFPRAIDDRIHPITAKPEPSKGSTDVGDISWRVPTGGLHTTCLAAGSPGHSWQNVAAIGSSIGVKGTLYAAKVMAITALDLLEQSDLRANARDDWQKRMKGRTYVSFIPDGQPAPRSIR